MKDAPWKRTGLKWLGFLVHLVHFVWSPKHVNSFIAKPGMIQTFKPWSSKIKDFFCLKNHWMVTVPDTAVQVDPPCRGSGAAWSYRRCRFSGGWHFPIIFVYNLQRMNMGMLITTMGFLHWFTPTGAILGRSSFFVHANVVWHWKTRLFLYIHSQIIFSFQELDLQPCHFHKRIRPPKPWEKNIEKNHQNLG